MRKARTKIYINANYTKQEFIYTGIEFHEFEKYLKTPMENVLLLKANYLGNCFQKNFDLVEGSDFVRELTKEDVHNFGDFCFVDYTQPNCINQLKDEQIAELLYMAHMCNPLGSPFFETLGNRFAYLAHDDGWFCKLYCRCAEEFGDVLVGKIKDRISGKLRRKLREIDATVQKDLLRIAEGGILIDLDDTHTSEHQIIVEVYTIGEYTDMDVVYNQCQKLKDCATNHHYLKYNKNQWALE
jgi:hypothetical protein